MVQHYHRMEFYTRLSSANVAEHKTAEDERSCGSAAHQERKLAPCMNEKIPLYDAIMTEILWQVLAIRGLTSDCDVNNIPRRQNGVVRSRLRTLRSVHSELSALSSWRRPGSLPLCVDEGIVHYNGRDDIRIVLHRLINRIGQQARAAVTTEQCNPNCCLGWALL